MIWKREWEGERARRKKLPQFSKMSSTALKVISRRSASMSFQRMRLLTNSNNLNSLKLLIASDLSGQKLEVQFVAPGKDSKYASLRVIRSIVWISFCREVLPVLQCGNARLFVPSAATLLLLQESDWNGAKQVSAVFA